MGKAGKWLMSFWTPKQEYQKTVNSNKNNNNTVQNAINPVAVAMPRSSTPKEKRRWSFRRSSASANPNSVVAGQKESTNSFDPNHTSTIEHKPESVVEKTQSVVVATKEEHDEEVTEKSEITAVNEVKGVIAKYGAAEEAAAIKIQSVFRSSLARKALKALRGLVKLQALIRGHMVRKGATTTLKCMHALITAQARARAQRIQMLEDGKTTSHGLITYRRNTSEKIKHSYHDMEENIKIVEMDNGESRSKNKSKNSYSVSSQQQEINLRTDDTLSTCYSSNQESYLNQDYQHIFPTPSAISDISPRTCSGYLDGYSYATAQSSPQCYSAKSKPDLSPALFTFPRPDIDENTMFYDYPLYPNYMANTESSRAKARSQSAPKQRPEFERQPSRGRRASVEGRGIPKGARMQRSSSHVGSTAQANQYPWSIKLDKSIVSLKDSECGSTCSVFSNANYCRSFVSYNPRYSLKLLPSSKNGS